MLSMVTHSLAGVSMASVSMAGKEEKDDIVFYDRLIGDGKAYIDTGIPSNTISEIAFTYKYPSYASYVHHYIFSGYQSWEVNFFFSQMGNTFVHNCDNYGSEGGYALSISAPTKNKDYVVKWSRPNHTIEFDGVLKTFTKYGSSPSKKNLKVIAHTIYLSPIEFVVNGKSLIFRPCTYNGEAGIYDVVNEVFYGNANTEGSFSVAND